MDNTVKWHSAGSNVSLDVKLYKAPTSDAIYVLYYFELAMPRVEEGDNS